MSRYQEAIEKLYGKYEKPVIEEVTVGFTGIDPQRKYAGTDDHEILRSLLGGDDNGHYHLTLEELEWLREQMREKYPPLIADNQEITITDSEEMTAYENLKPTISDNQEIIVLLDTPMTPYAVQGKNLDIG